MFGLNMFGERYRPMDDADVEAQRWAGPATPASTYSGAGTNSNLFGGANDFANTAFYGAPGSVGKMLQDAASRAGVNDYDFNAAAWKAAPGYGWQLPGASGWQLGANEEQIYRNILQNTDDPRLQALANERSDASYQTGAQAGVQRDVELAKQNAANKSGMSDIMKLALLAGGIYTGGAALGAWGGAGGLSGAAGLGLTEAELAAAGAGLGSGIEGAAISAGASGGLSGGAALADLSGFMTPNAPLPWDAAQPSFNTNLFNAAETGTGYTPGALSSSGLVPPGYMVDLANSGNLISSAGAPLSSAGVPAAAAAAIPANIAVESTGLGGLEGAGIGLSDAITGAQAGAAAAQPSLLSRMMSRVSSAFGGSSGGGGGVGSGVGLGSLASLMSIGSGIYGLTEAQKLRKLAEMQAAKADPWGTSGGRGVADEQLQGLLKDPNKITTMPGYEAGLQAVQRSMAANGYLGSGNMMTALAKYGGDFYNNAVAQLSGLAGANVNPGTAAGYVINGATSANDLASRSLASIGYGATGNNGKITDILLQRYAAGLL